MDLQNARTGVELQIFKIKFEDDESTTKVVQSKEGVN